MAWVSANGRQARHRCRGRDRWRRTDRPTYSADRRAGVALCLSWPRPWSAGSSDRSGLRPGTRSRWPCVLAHRPGVRRAWRRSFSKRLHHPFILPWMSRAAGQARKAQGLHQEADIARMKRNVEALLDDTLHVHRPGPHRCGSCHPEPPPVTKASGSACCLCKAWQDGASATVNSPCGVQRLIPWANLLSPKPIMGRNKLE